mmetsp:Transcript_22256/g.53917  ORF Transcript_22256/g.53917 Transcript_22256/m.53917 type:complete len:376 (+) Transcript_22256:27-1154(+)
MKYYKLECASLPDKLYNKSTDVKEWLALATTANGKFPPSSLNKVVSVERDVELDRIIGISLYMLGNVFPFVLPLLVVASFVSDVGMLLLKLVLLYWGSMMAVTYFYALHHFRKKYNRPPELSDTDIKDNQYLSTERNNQKYMSMKYVWPESIHKPALDDQPSIFCVIPHGVAPFGITAYPVWSKLFNDRLCHWTCAPIILKLPLISTYMRKVGYIPAKAKHISDTLMKKEDNVGIVLDGVAGMFQNDDEVAYIKQRKGIIKIALRAGVPIVPVYGFGHTKLYNILVDPFGILRTISVKLDVSVCPFFGRWGWFLGPPHRVAVCVCLGEPVQCPKIAEPTQAEIDLYHSRLLKAYEDLFEQHKEAYGWGDKKLKFA